MKTFFTSFLFFVLGAATVGGSVYFWNEDRLESLPMANSELNQSVTVEPEPSPPQTVVENPYEGLVLPQVYFMTKANYYPEELEEIQAKIIDPLVTYYESQGQIIVSIEIDNDNRTGFEKNRFIIDCIIAQKDGDQNPGYFGFLVDKVNGEIPLWQPEVMDEGYRG